MSIPILDKISNTCNDVQKNITFSSNCFVLFLIRKKNTVGRHYYFLISICGRNSSPAHPAHHDSAAHVFECYSDKYIPLTTILTHAQEIAKLNTWKSYRKIMSLTKKKIFFKMFSLISFLLVYPGIIYVLMTENGFWSFYAKIINQPAFSFSVKSDNDRFSS